MDNGIIRLDGTVNLMVIVQGNKLLSPLTRDVQLSVVVNPKKYPLDTPTHRNQTKARILTAYVQDFIDEHHYLFSEKPEVNIPFGVFKKTNKGIAETFNITSKIYIERILNSATDISILDEAITYWKSQIEIDFGKKMKDKIKDKVIYVNLTSASILKNDMDNAKKYHESVKKNSGFFDTWTIDYDKFFQRSEHINDLKGHSLPSMAITPNVIYLIAINRGGVYMYNNKQTEFSRIEIERFVPTVQSGISSLDRYGKPRIFIYKEDGSLIIHNGGKQNQIITSSGEEITFKESKGVFRPYVKQKNGNLSIFYGL